MAQNGLPGPDRELDGWIWSNVEAETDGKVLKEKKGRDSMGGITFRDVFVID